MSTHNRRLDKICVVIVAVSLLLTVLFMNGESLGITMIVDEDAESYSGTTYFTINDQNSDWDTEGATVITLTGDGAEISGNGAYVNGQEVVITEAGRYVVSGSLSDGKITVDAHNSSKVWILLDGVDINCSDDACIRVDQAEKVFLTLAENSVNTLTSGSTYSDTALQDGTDGAIFAHDDLTINGSGSLSVTAEYRHGIAANDDLVITGGTITIKAAADAIHANDSVCIKEAQITVDAGDDGIVTANEEENGYMYIESGTIDITSVGDGIHTTGDITIAGGSITIAAGDDGIHSDQFVYIEDGEILINECYEGIEALIIDVSGGDITIYPEDDGFNANGGSSDMFGGGPGQGGMQGSSKEEGLGQDGFDPVDMSSDGDSSGQMEQTAEETQSSETAAEEEETYISISGGTITIINDSGRDADGLDSNEDIRISGGTIYISLLGSGSNCAVDYGSESGGVAEITGGTIIACGASSMAEGFSSTSTQASILYNTSTVADEGTTLALKDGEGNVLLSWEVPCSFSSALISCPEMQVGNSYQVVIGDSSEEITIEEISSSYGDAQSGMTGGGMGGGMQPGGGFEGWPFNDTAEGTTSEDSASEDSTENAQSDMPEMPEGMQGGPGGHGGHGGRTDGQAPPDMSRDGATE
ncbi:MAG: carbohydrate-binding domain-containing protein, partial [Lachnospiraceae bacterium]|nr:carbohydrate-binding domain-containing protein [Lachnospiraceae bacterium]